MNIKYCLPHPDPLWRQPSRWWGAGCGLPSWWSSRRRSRWREPCNVDKIVSIGCLFDVFSLLRKLDIDLVWNRGSKKAILKAFARKPVQICDVVYNLMDGRHRSICIWWLVQLKKIEKSSLKGSFLETFSIGLFGTMTEQILPTLIFHRNMIGTVFVYIELPTGFHKTFTIFGQMYFLDYEVWELWYL